MPDTAKNKTSDEVVEIADELRVLAEQAHALADRLRGVRGTRNITREIQAIQSQTGRIARQPIDLDLYHRVRKMLETEPMRLAQLVEATGQTDNKIKVLITKMQRDGVHLVNIGAANKALWFIPSPKALDRLEHMTDED